MGLFSNNKKLCPICGSPTPRLLATVVDDQPLCKACAAKIDLPDGSLANMSIEAFRNYLDFYEENRPLREQFPERLDRGVVFQRCGKSLTGNLKPHLHFGFLLHLFRCGKL